MGGPAPVVSDETQQAVDAAEPATLAQVAPQTSITSNWFVVRQDGTDNFLGDVPNTNSQPYETDAGFAPFGPQTYFFGTAEAAAEVLVGGTMGSVQGLTLTATFN